MPKVLTFSDDMDIHIVDSAEVLPMRADKDASKTENTDPVTASEIEPESEEYLDAS
jgi:hypothetical protein